LQRLKTASEPTKKLAFVISGGLAKNSIVLALP